ncbi:hypothetical protein LguiB_009077 [Lonicera macranthoides]
MVMLVSSLLWWWRRWQWWRDGGGRWWQWWGEGGEMVYVKEGLLLGQLHGNRFTITLSGVVADSEDIIKSSADALGDIDLSTTLAYKYFPQFSPPSFYKTSVKTEELPVASLTELLCIITSSVLSKYFEEKCEGLELTYTYNIDQYKLGLRREGRRSPACEDHAESDLRREVERRRLLLSRSSRRRSSLRRSNSRQQTSAFASLRDNTQIFIRS